MSKTIYIIPTTRRSNHLHHPTHPTSGDTAFQATCQVRNESKRNADVHVLADQMFSRRRCHSQELHSQTSQAKRQAAEATALTDLKRSAKRPKRQAAKKPWQPLRQPCGESSVTRNDSSHYLCPRFTHSQRISTTNGAAAHALARAGRNPALHSLVLTNALTPAT